MANVVPTAFYVSSVGWTAVAPWSVSVAKTAGQMVRAVTPLAQNERVFVCIVAGTTNTVQPGWILTKGAKSTDNTVTWMECTGQAGSNGDVTNTPTWAQQKALSSAVVLGLIIKNAASDHLFIVTTAGTIGAAEPTALFGSAILGTGVPDNTAAWTCISITNAFAPWSAPNAKLATALAPTWGGANAPAGNTYFVADTHAETQSTAVTHTATGTSLLPTYIWCVDATAAVPPTGANLRTTATVTNTGNTGMTLAGSHYTYGITYSAGTGAFGNFLTVSGVRQIFQNCSLRKPTTSGYSGSIDLQSSEYLLLDNTTVSLGSTADVITFPNQGTLICRNASPFIVGATIPTTMFQMARNGVVNLSNLDLSPVTGTIIDMSVDISGFVSIVDCKIAAAAITSGISASPCVRVELVSSDSTGKSSRAETFTRSGTKTVDTVIVKTAGATDGTTPQSHKIVTTANSSWFFPFESVPISIWNSITATNRVVTVNGIRNSASLPNNDQIWITVQYLGASGNPQGFQVTNGKANGLSTGSALPADSTSTWNSLATARVNSATYSVGNTISVSSSSRLFFCTTGGAASGSLPGGYATAIDGGSVTDNAAIFLAGTRFSLSTTLSSPQPGMTGPIIVTVFAALPSSTFWIDPLIILS